MERFESSFSSESFVDAAARTENEYSAAAFWFLYGRLEKSEMARQLSEMVDKGIRQGFLHPRAYLTTAYLEDEWWEAIGHAIENSRSIGFTPWLYDEYAWPSGTAGSTFKYSAQKPSRVLSAGESNMAKGLEVQTIEIESDTDSSAIFSGGAAPFCAVLMGTHPDGTVKTGTMRLLPVPGAGSPMPVPAGSEVMVFRLRIHPLAVDYLNKDTIKTFLETTHEEYRKRWSADFGALIPGIFFDEIFNAASPIAWTDGFDRQFRERRGYDPLPLLPLLIRDGDSRTAEFRKDYYAVVSELYEEAFFKQIGDWCGKNGLFLTGHTEEWIAEHPLRQGDYFRTMRHLQIPGADCHDYRYRYPRIISLVEPKGAVSVARLNGRERVMSEALGGGGWATSLQEFKRGVNVLAAMGINLFVLHGFSYESDHQGSQGDWPVSFFFQNPYWRHFGIFSAYIARLSKLGAMGSPVCRVGVIYPIGSLRERFRNGKATDAGKLVAERYNGILEALLRRQIDADLVDEDGILRAELVEGTLSVAQESFSLIAVPGASGLSEAARDKLARFETGGGRLLVYDVGDESGLQETISGFRAPIIVRDLERDLGDDALLAVPRDFELLGAENRSIFYYRREYAGVSYFLVVNGTDQPCGFEARFLSGGQASLIDIETGISAPLAGAVADGPGRTRAPLRLGPDQAVCVYFDAELKPAALVPRPESVHLDLPPEGWTLRPLPAGAASALPGDAVRMELGHAEFRTRLRPYWDAIRVRNRTGEKGRCGRHATQWTGQWITRRPSWADDSCEKRLYFRKTFDLDEVPRDAFACVASVDRFEAYVNGSPAMRGAGWRSPTVFPIGSLLRRGENSIAILVENDQPLPGKNMLEAENFDPDSLTSLLAEFRIETSKGRAIFGTDDSWIVCGSAEASWNGSEFRTEAVRVDCQKITFPWGLEKLAQWQYAWCRGSPPLLPWGPLPLFGEGLPWPLPLEYRFLLPAGTARAYRPDVRGDCRVFVGGMDMTRLFAENEYVEIAPTEGESRTELRIAMDARDAEDGLLSPLSLEVRAVERGLPDWRDLGWTFYSGEMEYRSSFVLLEMQPERRVMLDLGAVHFHAEVLLNGISCGARIWSPYRFDLTDAIQTGSNELRVVVSNLAANTMSGALLDEGRALGWNRYWYGENISRDSKNLRSGLFGPVRILVG